MHVHNIHNFLHHISQEVMVMGRRSTGKNTDTSEKSSQTQTDNRQKYEAAGSVLRKRGEESERKCA